VHPARVTSPELYEPADAPEPVARWPEARPPHLPDRITALPWQVWPFLGVVVLSVVDAWTIWTRMAGLTTDFPFVYLMSAVPKLAAGLAGAAFFWRHPDGWRELRAIAAGVSLFAVAAILELVAGGVQIAIDGVIGPLDGVSTVTLTSLLFGLVPSVVASIGIAAIAVGLRRSLGPIDVTRSRRIPVALILFVGVVAVARLMQLRSLDWGTDLMDAMRVTSALGGAAAVVVLLAWSWLLVVGIDGRRLGARPPAGWTAVVLASVAVLVIAAVTVAAGTLITESGFQALGWIGSALLPAIAVLNATASLLFALAFALGLPATEPTTEAATGATDDPSAVS
jgi:hypothetical protein